MKLPTFITFALAVMTAQPAIARDWPTTGGWYVTQLDTACAMSMEYDGPGETELHFILGTDGRQTLVLTNSGWSTREREEYSLRFVLDGVLYEGGATVGTRIDGRQGFRSTFEPDFARHLAAGASLRIYNGDTLVDQLSLGGTAAALGMVQRCLTQVRSEMSAAERERQRWAHIPRDPFAGATPSAPAAAPVGGARAATMISGVITGSDYPASALRAHAQGRTVVRYLIGVDVRVASCAVVGSSGDATLDSTTCILVQRRFRFTPATDANGNPTSSTHSTTVNWSLPPEPTPVAATATGSSAALQPAREWAQISSGTISRLREQLSGVRARAPALLGRREAYVSGTAGALRLVVGPFMTVEEANAFVAQLRTLQVPATIWSSVEGEVVLPIAQWPGH